MPEKEIPPHIQRVIEEKKELDGKIHRLREFMGTPEFAGLTFRERSQLQSQLYPMQGYSEALSERLVTFWNPEASHGNLANGIG